MPSLFDLSSRIPGAMWGNKKPRYGSGNANGLDYTTQPVKPLGMPGGMPGATGYSTGRDAGGANGTGGLGGYALGGPGMTYGTGGLEPNDRSGNPPMMPPVNGAYAGLGGTGAPSGTGAAPMQTGSQGTINNYNMTPELQAQLDKARQIMKDNLAGSGFEWRERPGGPGFGPDHTGLPGGVGGQRVPGSGAGDGGGRLSAPRMGDAVAAQAANWQNPDWVMQQVLAGKVAPQTWQQQQAMLDQLQANDPAKYAEYIAKMQAMGVNPRQAPTVGTSGNPFGN